MTPSASSKTVQRRPETSILLSASRSPSLTRAIPLVALLAFTTLAIILAFTKVWPSAFDELEHVSYAAWLQETGHLLPDLPAMHTLAANDLTHWNPAPNYLSHPSPYYLYIAPFLDRTLPPRQAIILPRLASAALVAIGVALTLVAARRHLPPSLPGRGRVWVTQDARSETEGAERDPLALIIFCLLAALCPKILAVAGQVTNDALALLAGGLAYWAASTIDRRPWPARAALALAMLLALAAKPNAAICIGAFLGVYALLRFRILPTLLPPLILGSLIGVIPYVIMLRQYGSLVPISVEQFGGVHQLGSFAAYIPAFLVNLAFTWCYAQTGTWPLTTPASALATAMIWLLLACTLLGALLAARDPAPSLAPCRAIAIAAPIAFIIVLPIHFWFSAYNLGFSIPAASFRYYLPIWPALAHAIAWAVARAPRAWQRHSIAALAIATLVIGWLSPGATD